MKKVLLGLVVLSAVTMASEGSIFTNRIGVNYGTNGHEKWKDGDSEGVDVFNDSMGLNFKSLYNVTDNFRFGLELGYDTSSYSSDVKTLDMSDDDRIGMLMGGIATEYDFIHLDKVTISMVGSLGLAYNDSEFKGYENGDINQPMTINIKAKSYMKFGLGARLDNGLGLEIGQRLFVYDYDLKSTVNDDDTMTRTQTYFEINYTF